MRHSPLPSTLLKQNPSGFSVAIVPQSIRLGDMVSLLPFLISDIPNRFFGSWILYFLSFVFAFYRQAQELLATSPLISSVYSGSACLFACLSQHPLPFLYSTPPATSSACTVVYVLPVPSQLEAMQYCPHCKEAQFYNTKTTFCAE